jgi:hypothetical protein
MSLLASGCSVFWGVKKPAIEEEEEMKENIGV